MKKSVECLNACLLNSIADVDKDEKVHDFDIFFWGRDSLLNMTALN